MITGSDPSPRRRVLGPTRGARLTIAMNARGIYKLSVLAQLLNVSESAISRWRSDSTMTLANVETLCLELRISADWLLFGIGDMELSKATAREDHDPAVRLPHTVPSRIRESLVMLIEALSTPH